MAKNRQDESAVVPANYFDLLENGCRYIAEARSLDDVLLIRDQAQAFQHFARQRGYGVQAQNDGAEIKLRAERRLGEIIKDQELNQGGRPPKTGNTMLPVLPTLSDLGIEKIQSSRWQKVASVPEPEFETHIAAVRAKEQELTTAGVLKLAKKNAQQEEQEQRAWDGCTVADLQTLVDDGEKFGTIYADPPWQYGNQATRAATDNHYVTMTVDDIAALPVGELADDLCHLHLWTTNAFLFDCPRLFDAWGFKFQGAFIWCKEQMGIGNCYRVSHEYLLLAIKGEPRRFDVKDIKSYAVYPRGKHSSKPEEARQMIERVSPGPYLELFGRRAVDGWAVWGNEIERDLFTASMGRR